MMKNRNIVVAIAIATIVGSAAAFAGNKSCGHDKGSHGFGGHHRGPMMQRMIGKLEHHLDLSDQQLESLEQIMLENKESLSDGRMAGRNLRHETMKLDPTSDTFDAEASVMADQIAELARNQALIHASVFKQIAGILDQPQRQEMRELMRRHREKAMKHSS